MRARAHSQLAIYTVFHAESESAVRNLRKLQENQNFKKTKMFKIFPPTPYLTSYFPIFYFSRKLFGSDKFWIFSANPLYPIFARILKDVTSFYTVS